MAFIANNAAAVSSINASGNDVSWQAQGFLNIHLPNKAGTRNPKLGAIPLKDKVASEKELREWLESDVEGNTAKLMNKIMLEYVSASNEGFELAPKVVEESAEQKADRASGYINFYLPTKDGGQKKLGVVVLNDKYVNEANLRIWLEADEANLKELVNTMVITYNSAKPKAASSGFDLS